MIYFWPLPLHLTCVTRPNQTYPSSTDIFGSLTRCYRPLPCCKVSIQLQSPLFDSGDRLMWSSPSSAERGVYSDQLHLEQDIWSEHCQNPLQSSCQPKTTCATTHQSETGLSTSVAMRENLVWVCEYIKKKFSDDISFNSEQMHLGRTSPNPFLINSTMLEVELNSSKLGIKYILGEHWAYLLHFKWYRDFCHIDREAFFLLVVALHD